MSKKGDIIQVHMLTSYPAVLLNRDDAGLAKRITYGGVERTRVSSQCLKKHWRESDIVSGLGDLAVRSRRGYVEFVERPLIEQHGASEEAARLIAEKLIELSLGSKASDKRPGETGNIVVLSDRELAYLASIGVRILESAREAGIEITDAKSLDKVPAAKLSNEDRANIRLLPAALDVAMFGRMVTGDLFARMDAAVSVAHAFTTHAEASEIDYFTAVDTLQPEEESGAAHMDGTELTSGVFYSYVVIDMNELRRNLGANESLAEPLARNLIMAMATVSPGAKRGATAPFAFADFVMVERGSAQPRSLAAAFQTPVRANGQDLGAASAAALLAHKSKIEAMYGDGPEAFVATIHEVDIEAMPLAAVLDATFGG